MLLPSSILTHKTGGSSGFVPNGLNFYNGGSGNNYLTTTSLSGVPNGPTGSISIWARFDGGDGVPLAMKESAASGIKVLLTRSPDNNISLQVNDSTGTKHFTAIGTTTTATGTGWHNILVSWDTNHTAGNKIANLYVDSISTSPSLTDASASFTVGYAEEICAFPRDNLNVQISLAEIWYAPNQFIDFSVSGNRALFYNAGNAVDLGSDGSTPTGLAPAVYIHNPAATAGINLGTGGNFTTVGVITDTSPPP